MCEAIYAGLAILWRRLKALVRPGEAPERPGRTHRGRLVLQHEEDVGGGLKRSVVTSSPWSLPIDKERVSGVTIVDPPVDLKPERLTMAIEVDRGSRVPDRGDLITITAAMVAGEPMDVLGTWTVRDRTITAGVRSPSSGLHVTRVDMDLERWTAVEKEAEGR